MDPAAPPYYGSRVKENLPRPSSLKLTYFDAHGGRGEPIRIALSIGGVPFVDERLNFKDWLALKPSTTFGSLPLLEADGQRLTQSNAMLRYAGRLAGLYPTDPWLAAQCDEACDAVEHLSVVNGPSYSLRGDEQRAERERLAAGPIPQFLKGLDALLASRGGGWFAGPELTVADLKVEELVRSLTSGRMDHIPTDIVERNAPALVAHARRVDAHPAVRAYRAKKGL